MGYPRYGAIGEEKEELHTSPFRLRARHPKNTAPLTKRRTAPTYRVRQANRIRTDSPHTEVWAVREKAVFSPNKQTAILCKEE